jgi:hypothetical protein
MTKADDQARLRAAQIDAITAALAARPGLTAYQLGLHLPVAPPAAGQMSASLPAEPAPLTLTVGLLADMVSEGWLRREPDPAGARWYLTGQDAEVVRVQAGWCVCWDGPDGTGYRDAFYNQVIAEKAANAIRRTGGYDRDALVAEDLALAEGVTS